MTTISTEEEEEQLADVLSEAFSEATTETVANPAETSYQSLSCAYQMCLRHDETEQNHWDDVCRSYRQYAIFAMQQWANQQYRLHSLTEDHRKYLPSGLRQETPEFSQRAANYKEAAIRNQFCLDCILRHAGQPHSQTPTSSNAAFSSDSQMSKISSVLKSLARDWSEDGKPERDMAYKPLIERVQHYLPITDRPFRLCVPGAGVSRLACELAGAGYAVQGNEFSLYMLLASDFVLNGPLDPSSPLQISPYLLESRNVHAVQDPLRAVRIPDVDPYTMLMKRREGNPDAVLQPPPEFSVAAGEFLSIYSAEKERGQWDGVVACFFLDTSPSIVDYLLTIYQMLRPGGYLFHFGPLLWHWSGPAMRPDDKTVAEYRQRYSYLDARYLTSIDLSWDDVREIITNVGFEIVESSTGHHALYTADRRSMMNMHYRCIQFVARKPDELGV